MGFITWSDDWALGIKKIDIQHQKLIQIINDLNDAMREGHGKDKLGTTLQELYLYTQYHFREEENSFAAVAYPDADMHR